MLQESYYNAKIPHKVIIDYGKYIKSVNAYRIHLCGEILQDKRVIDITRRLADTLDARKTLL